jgi:hypothetical protein
MALSKKIITGGLAVLAFVASAAAATAAPAYATGNVNVRSGPGTHYGVIDALRRGEQVDVQQCRGGWCYVEKRGPDGWVSANYLARDGRGGWDDDDYWDRTPPRWDPRPPRWNPAPPPPPYWGDRPHRPYPGYGFPNRPHSGGNVCVNGPNGYFCIGN